MATIASSTFLALVLSTFFSLNAFALSDDGKIKKAFARKQYKRVMAVFKRSSRKKTLMKNEKVLLILAISAEKIKKYNYAYSFYYKKLIRENGKTFKRVNKRIQNGDLVDSSRVSKSFKLTSWKVLTTLFSWLKEQREVDKKFKKRLSLFNKVGNLLIELEFRDDKADRLLTDMNYHVDELGKNKRKLKYYLTFEYLTWQKEADIEAVEASKNGGLVVTTNGLCLGGGVNYENYYTAFNLDTCAILGLGKVSLNSGNLGKYQQENIPTYGLKVSPGFSFFVSEKRAEVGLKLPMTFIIQDLEIPTASATLSPNDYTINEGSDFQILASLYSKWPVGKYFISTQFSKFISNDLTMWSLGFGKNF